MASYSSSSRAWPLPLKGHYLIYGEAGVGKSALTSYLIDSCCFSGRSSVYVCTEDELTLLHLRCDEVRTAIVRDYKEMLLALLEAFSYDCLALDSISAFTRFLPPSLGSRVSAFTSWLMHERAKRGKLSVTVAQKSSKTGRAPYYEFVEPWADYVLRVERRGRVKRAVVAVWPEGLELERCFEIRGGIEWVPC